MECNHIVPEAQGGADTLDNCIPFCFDCHADVGHYNAKHPKGNKYTGGTGHRDRWYEKVKTTAGLVASPETRDVDRQTFHHLRELLPSDPGYTACCEQIRLSTGCQKSVFSFNSLQFSALIFPLENINHQLGPR
jgi:hypothetical protein